MMKHTKKVVAIGLLCAAPLIAKTWDNLLNTATEANIAADWIMRLDDPAVLSYKILVTDFRDWIQANLTSATISGTPSITGGGGAALTIDGNGQPINLGDTTTPLVISDAGGVTLPSDGTLNASNANESNPFVESTDCSAIANEGAACWETDADKLWIGDGAAPPTEIGAGSGSAATISTYPWGVINTGSGNTHDANACNCYLRSLPAGLADLDTITLAVKTVDADDTVEVAVYSLDGATQYFEATLDVTTANDKDLANDLTGTVAMPAGDYWICQIQDNTTMSYELQSYQTEGTYIFDQAGCNGEAPATLTSPTKTWATTPDAFWAVVRDD